MPDDGPFDGRSSSALVAVVLTVSVEVTVLLAGGVTELGLKLQVGPWLTTGVTAQVRATAELNPLVEVTVIVDVAETPGLPEVADRAPSAMEKLLLPAPVVYLTTKASKVPPPNV